MNDQESAKIRLSDRILSALQLSVEQKDVDISELLKRALDLSMTRNSGGEDFVERRMYPCLLYTSPSPRDQRGSRMPSSA